MTASGLSLGFWTTQQRLLEKRAKRHLREAILNLKKARKDDPVWNIGKGVNHAKDAEGLLKKILEIQKDRESSNDRPEPRN